MGVPLDNEGLIKYSILVTLVGTPSKLPAYDQMCATMSWSAVKFLLVIKWPPDWERVTKLDTIDRNWPGNESRNESRLLT